MAKYEQEIILQEVIVKKAAVTARMSALIQSPIPQDDVSFKKFLPNGSFANGRDRATYAVDHLVPLWEQKLTNSSERDRILELIGSMMLEAQK
jgi:hypothetical protein